MHDNSCDFCDFSQLLERVAPKARELMAPAEDLENGEHVRFGHDTAHAQEGALKAGMTYDPGESLFNTVFRWQGTLLPMVLQKPMFWSLMGVNFSLLVYHDYLLSQGEAGLPELAWDAAVVPMSLLTFFIVFYGQQSYSRYYAFYGNCAQMSTSLAEWMSMLKRHFGGDPACMWNAARLMLAAHHIVFGSLDGSVG